MILPTKGLDPEYALLSVGADILEHLQDGMSVAEIWERVLSARHLSMPTRPLSFDWFSLALDLLYAINVIDYDGELLRRGVQK
ncbi:hypothetical protein CDL60_10285 [Roseateles noduli]|nr:hypothetical protein CDL60_10285 [Roseateles noduli]